MRTTKQLSITLPNSMADALKERVASGAYASESEPSAIGRLGTAVPSTGLMFEGRNRVHHSTLRLLMSTPQIASRSA